MANDLHSLDIREVAFCERGMNKNAKIALFKADADPEDRMTKTALERLSDLAKSGAATVKHAAERALGIVKAADALAESTLSAIEDEAVVDKADHLRHSSRDFRTHIDTLVPADLEKTGAAMSDAIKKALGLADTATEADVTAAVVKLASAENAENATKLAKANEDLAKATAELNIAKLSAPHADYAAAKGMDGDAKAAFAAKTPAERDAHISAHPVSKSAEAIELEKRDGEIADLKKRLDVQEDVAKVATISKRVEPLKHIAKADELGALLHKVGKVDQPTADAIEKLFETANARIEKGELFKEAGSGQRGVADATVALTAKAEELRKADPKLSIEKARTQARAQNPELAKQETEEFRQRRAAA